MSANLSRVLSTIRRGKAPRLLEIQRVVNELCAERDASTRFCIATLAYYRLAMCSGIAMDLLAFRVGSGQFGHRSGSATCTKEQGIAYFLGRTKPSTWPAWRRTLRAAGLLV